MANDEWQFPAEVHKKALVKSFDPVNESLRTTITNASVDITVSAFSDSIKIGDAAGVTATITPVGAKKALDVNVTDITLDASNDSVSIKNGANALAVNADGSLNVLVAQKGYSTINQSGLVSVGATSTALFVANSNRKYIYVMNNSLTNAFIQYGSPAVLNQGIRLGAGAMLTLAGYEIFYGQINAISATTINLDILEGI